MAALDYNLGGMSLAMHVYLAMHVGLGACDYLAMVDVLNWVGIHGLAGWGVGSVAIGAVWAALEVGVDVGGSAWGELPSVGWGGVPRLVGWGKASGLVQVVDDLGVARLGMG